MLLPYLKRFWHDDAGSLLAAEWMVLTVLLTLGLVTGFTAVRQAVVSEMTELGGAVEILADPNSTLITSADSTQASSPASINQAPCD